MKAKGFKSLVRYSWMIIAVFVAFSSCKEEEPDPDPILVEDGIYIVGEATALTELDAKGFMSLTNNEVTQEARASLYEIYIAIEAGKGFNIVEVAGSEQLSYGPGSDFAVVAEADRITDEPGVDFWRGSYEESTSTFTVPENGLYHVVIDTELGVCAIAPVKWGVIGAATPNGWSGSTELPAKSFDLNKMEFELAEIAMIVGDWKFRYSDGWKIVLDEELDLGGGDKGVRVNTNLGGAVDALTPGGDNITNDTYAVYKVNMTWELGVGHSASITYVKDGPELAQFPEAMYLVGDGTAYGWDGPGTHAAALMHKCAGGAPMEGVFWKILHIEGGMGFKVSAENWGDPNLGFNEPDEFDAEGVEVSDNGGNMQVAESNMYIVVLDLRNDATKVSVRPAAVYGIGDAFGSWDEAVAANLFTIDAANKKLTSPALPAGGNIRMYADHPWIDAWWNAEFNVFDGVIEYRNDGGDQAAVAGTAGQVVTLMFDDNTGSIQ